jgi:hypothetical protein
MCVCVFINVVSQNHDNEFHMHVDTNCIHEEEKEMYKRRNSAFLYYIYKPIH